MTEFTANDYTNEVRALATYAANWFMNDLDRDYWDAIRNAIDDSIWLKDIPKQHLVLQYSENSNSAFDEGLIDLSNLTDTTTIHNLIETCAYYAIMNDVDKVARNLLHDMQNKLAAIMDHWFDQLYQLDTFQTEQWCDQRMKRRDIAQAQLDKVTAEYNHIDDI